MKELDLDDKADQIDEKLYRDYYNKNCCTILLGKCCARGFRKVRMKQVANRLKKMVEIENQMKVS